jgi:hypothetical protein
MMLGPGMSKLLSISTAPIARINSVRCARASPVAETLLLELDQMLAAKNGWYAFESALHFFPSVSASGHTGIAEWNAESGWRQEYEEMAKGLLFFAEDVFGGQFCLTGSDVCSFDPETGERERVASSLEEWAQIILVDYRVRTGQPLAHDWQAKHGRLLPGTRLMPKLPFVLGGKYQISNLASVESESSMRARGNLARQLRDLPDGAQVTYQVVE